MFSASRIASISAFCLCFLPSSVLFAQAGGGGSSGGESKMEVIVEAGKLLPDQIDGLTDNVSMFGLSLGLSKKDSSYFVQYALGSNDEDGKFQDIALGYRKDVGVNGLYGSVGGGIDLFKITREGLEDSNYYGGIHFSAGVMTLISKGLYVRMNMKFNFNPGVGMFLGFGILYRPSEDTM